MSCFDFRLQVRGGLLMISFIRRLSSNTSLARRIIMSLPARWDVYSPMGSKIPGTKFIAFKVPLKEELLKQVEEKDRFSPTILMKLIGDRGLKLEGIIDLTFTFKYYNREEFIKNSVGHKKIFTPGHAVPSENVFQEFAHAVKSFNAGGDDHIIGVHCTHGVNRTGYLICRYMIEEMDYEPDVAISLFGEARGHMLERDNYLQDLRNRKRGQSSFDPNFKAENGDHKPAKDSEHNPQKVKPRWRHNKADHPSWRRNYHTSTPEGVSVSHNSSPDFAGNTHRENPHSLHINHADTYNPYSWNINNPVDVIAHGRSDRYTHRRSIPDLRDMPPRHNPQHERFYPNWTGNDPRYYGHRFDPYFSHRRTHPHGDRRNGYGSFAEQYD